MTTVANALAAAFVDDPFYNAIAIDFAVPERAGILRHYFDDALREGERSGRSIVLPEGAAIWTLPVPPDAAVAENTRKHHMLAALLGPRGWRNYQDIIGFMAAQSKDAVDPAAWYLSILGVSPAAQGRGIARQLLSITLAEADARHQPCYLETFIPGNVPFYERFGFAVQSKHFEPVTARDYWIMARE